MKAAERLFAERGYDATSIRAIVAKARVNQAAINYHFDGKDGLYREVLRTAFRALTEQQLDHADEMKAMSREAALAEFVRRQLRPLLGRDEYSRHMRILNWETVRPTAVFRKLLSEEAAPFMGLAVELVRRFQPEADQRTLVAAAVWLVGQCSVFLRNREQLADPPLGLGARRESGGMAGATGQQLGRRRPRPAGLSLPVPEKIGECRKKSFFRACGRPEQMFEIQPAV